jgi:hypothetical protein
LTPVAHGNSANHDRSRIELRREIHQAGVLGEVAERGHDRERASRACRAPHGAPRRPRKRERHEHAVHRDVDEHVDELIASMRSTTFGAARLRVPKIASRSAALRASSNAMIGA